MEQQTLSSNSSKWSLAARDGLILAAVTVVISTLIFLTRTNFLSSILVIVKLVGSIWVLRVIMRRYGNDHPGKSTFGYGFLVCVFSSIVCAIWSFAEYQYLFPEAAHEIFEQLEMSLAQMGSMLPEDTTDILFRMEDHYAQINCITTFFWCTLLGLIFSAILSRTGKPKQVFTEEEMKQNNDEDELIF